ncbi:MAG: hypothetical protein ACUZ8H_04405 [Candidatus Anammoxibacter sp.]
MKKWYLMLIYDKQNRIVKFVFLDNGVGIPNTIKKRFYEQIPIFTKMFHDNALIHSALKGEGRTSTKQSHRGKGLPKIYRCATEKKEIKKLVIVSNYGYLDLSNQDYYDLKSKFNGTLYSWEMSDD